MSMAILLSISVSMPDIDTDIDMLVSNRHLDIDICIGCAYMDVGISIDVQEGRKPNWKPET